MRKVRLSMLMETIASHLIVKQKAIVGFVLEKRNGELRAKPISDLAPLHHWGMIILPRPITSMPKSLRQFAEMVEMLDTYMPIWMDITIAGYVALTLDPLLPNNVMSRERIWMALDSPDELIEIEFTDCSRITVTERQLRLLDYAMDLNVVKTAHVLTP